MKQLTKQARAAIRMRAEMTKFYHKQARRLAENRCSLHDLELVDGTVAFWRECPHKKCSFALPSNYPKDYRVRGFVVAEFNRWLSEER